MELTEIRNFGAVVSLGASFVMAIYLFAQRKHIKNAAQIERTKERMGQVEAQQIRQEERIVVLEKSNENLNNSLATLLVSNGKIEGQMVGFNHTLKIIEEHLIKHGRD